MSKMNRLAVDILMKRGIDPDQERSEQDAEKHQMTQHLDDLIKNIHSVRMDRTVPEYIRQVEELITALRNYNLVPEQPKPVILQPEDGEEVPF
jgi:hypothetical protein